MDIRLSNLMVTFDGIAKIIDFGQGKFLTKAPTNKDDLAASPPYLPPEVVKILLSKTKQDIEHSQKHDIYSLGVTLP